MYIVFIDDAVANVFTSPVAADMYVKDLKRFWGLEAYVVHEQKTRN